MKYLFYCKLAIFSAHQYFSFTTACLICKMLKRKLEQQTSAIGQQVKPKLTTLPGAINSEMFSQPFWMNFYEIECNLNEQLARLDYPKSIKCTYNPVEYAASLHCAYLRRYLNGRKQVMFIGMNPGPNGMGQTGVSPIIFTHPFLYFFLYL